MNDDFDEFTAWTEDFWIAQMKCIAWMVMGTLFGLAAWGFLG
jgi:hypothetical protein